MTNNARLVEVAGCQESCSRLSGAVLALGDETGANSRPEIAQRLSEDGPETGHRVDRTRRGEEPEEEYAFKPDGGVRSFGQILGHIADANYLFCSPVLGENSPSQAIEKTKTTKAELTSAVRAAFAYCNRAYDALTDANANETVKAFGQERNKLGVLWFNASHNLEHYGNLVVYMRLKGIVPPSSDPKPR